MAPGGVLKGPEECATCEGTDLPYEKVSKVSKMITSARSHPGTSAPSRKASGGGLILRLA